MSASRIKSKRRDEIFRNKGKLNTSNIDDALTNQCLALIAGYYAGKIERQIDCIMFRKTLYDSCEDPLDKVTANILNLRKNIIICIPSNSVHNCSFLGVCFPSHVVRLQELKYSQCDKIPSEMSFGDF